ncbi:diflavin oxidoreductase [Leucothrix arctica]|uniref:assimilatory sulfite reductase (NADPH) n=1 Tax=Leucothrix arctica TaxID=1481894 RepID=A0A317CCQ0_9GAMM|nr:flavodoxin domain-containing protein [Leucothrix arctica]PWQ96157.1 sulfite reductase subunit alpha [Leucothrix arctica]
MNNDFINQLATIIDTQANDPTVVELPEDAPFEAEQREWLSGLLTAYRTIAQAAASANEDVVGTPMQIYYGSQSGNAEVLVKDLKKYAATQGFEASIDELDSITPAELAAHSHILIVCSTFGEGEPPDNAKHFYTSLMEDEALALPDTLNFSVCGLGDSSYAFFNKCGEDISQKLSAAGAVNCQDFIACDVDFDDSYGEWKGSVFETEVFKSAAGAANTSVAANDDDIPAYDKNRPFIGNLISGQNLSAEQSAKRVNHIEISLAGGGEDMHYDVGDALGVWPLNCPAEVEEILAAGGFTGREVVEQKNGSASLRVLLNTKLDITTVNAKALETWGIESVEDDFQVIDVLTQLKPGLDAQTLVNGLRTLQPRLYSIASSPKKHPSEVHLTIGEVHYDLFEKARKGVASTFLGNRLTSGGNFGVYIQSSAHFHIPVNDEAPLIMIGPGTGIAPFRAFLEEREMRQAIGKNWLFFGDQHEAQDFLYRDEIAAWQDSGLLTETSLAWSRDTDKKVYVQTHILEQGEQFYEWLESGAYIYICGDASRMAADVDKAIRQVIAEHGGLDEAAVEAYMNKLGDEHRYQRDVY